MEMLKIKKQRYMQNIVKPAIYLLIFLLFACKGGSKKESERNLQSNVILPERYNYMELNWKIDVTPVLKRSQGKEYDSRVVGDPCIVWDDKIKTWRMFYFAGGYTKEGRWRVGTGMALSRSVEEIGPDDWMKIEPVKIDNQEALINPMGWHKWWIVMEADQNNKAARIGGKYWAVFTCIFIQEEARNQKHIQVASADELGGAWTVRAKPILSPDRDGFDGLHCDTPTAYWFSDRDSVIIFYKAYPAAAQELQPESPYGSGTMIAMWHPSQEKAEKIGAIQRPGRLDTWNQGWMSTPQIFYDKKKNQWYGLINGSPASPEDESNREPAPSLGGWVQCEPGKWVDSNWWPDTLNSPFLYPADLTEEQIAAGLNVNFWRHHLLETPEGRKRIFFNSGDYGHEQMYSMVAE